MYRTILLPTDGSEHSEAVTEHAVDLATQYGATVHALYVVDRGDVPSPDPEMRAEMLEHFRERGGRALSDVERACDEAGVDVVTKSVEGVPSDEIIDYAEDEGVDLIVMGTHGRTGLRHALIGSVAERVARHAPVPVLLVRLNLPDEDE